MIIRYHLAELTKSNACKLPNFVASHLLIAV